ncbi:MAG: folate-binding protein YgfZ [Bryobacterales bacterium]|nr:folate-binding protein YgfZ [Bryobacterales bacterium]
MNGWIDLSARGRIKVTGEDRKRLIHAMTTNHVQQLEPGQFCYAFFLTAQGRILADCTVLCAADHLLIDLEPEVREKILAHLDKYIIADDAYVEDVTAATAEIAVVGDGAQPAAAPSFRLRGVAHWVMPLDEKQAFIESLGDLRQLSGEEFRRWRLERGIPRYGEDFSESTLVQETQLMEGVHFSKGCYLGQEIVERVRSRGLIHKVLVPVRVEAREALPAGARLLANGKEAGKITSSVYSEALGAVTGLAYVRNEFAKPGTALTSEAGGAAAQVVEKG